MVSGDKTEISYTLDPEQDFKSEEKEEWDSMPGILRCDIINLNNSDVVNSLKDKLREVIKESKFYDLHISKKYYFKLDEEITINPGWYIIFEKDNPLYVGQSQNLNSRLNTEDGSRDQFADPTRQSDSERNFIKKFSDLGIFNELKVLPINEETICKKMELEFPLSKLDRNNIEKFINIFKPFLLTN